MQMAGNAYLNNNKPDEAVKLINDARKLFQKEGDNQGELEALQEILRVHVETVQKSEESGQQPPPDAVQNAAVAAQELAEHLQKLGDTVGQVAALIQLSALLRLSLQGKPALEAAQEALQISIDADRAQEVGMSLVALAEVHLFMEHGQEAKEAAEEAERFANQTGDKATGEAAGQLLEFATQLLEAPPKVATKTPAKSFEPSKRSKG